MVLRGKDLKALEYDRFVLEQVQSMRMEDMKY